MEDSQVAPSAQGIVNRLEGLLFNLFIWVVFFKGVGEDHHDVIAYETTECFLRKAFTLGGV
jgi:hypothetical protein